MSSGNPSKTTGQWHAAKGDMKEGLGKTFGSSNLTQQGQAERAAGKDQINAARGNTGAGTGTQGNTGFSGTGGKAGGIGGYGSAQPEDSDSQMGYNTTTVGQGYDSSNTGTGGNMGQRDGMGTDTAYNTFAPTSGATGTHRNDGMTANQQPGQFAQDTSLRDQDRLAKKNLDEYNRNAF
ncbi:hypothetical protein GALMADRAFT_214493 [Galerina marginata CBS 339.88]|uniref:CsbD-like domain-containing protein n=1 Tax=Galerina marginata (strain CBS 339.88) TaxID=685588 RepID=A0A067SHG8_GALM3|nr:hypothetical protein GALMADRAFT_214493 [Galerina marginata CBS 339.88]